MRRILGISAFYHDSAAALLVDGKIVAAAQEERFSRKKNDESFPSRAAAYCLQAGGLEATELDAVAFYEKPIKKFARSLETFLTIAPRGIKCFLQVMPNWLGGRLDLPRAVRQELPGLNRDCPILFAEHHQSHAASAFYPSPFPRAAILTVDGVGEYATTTVGIGEGDKIELLNEIRFPHSLGLLYSAFTAYCGFRVNSGEYKLMGLAPYGEPAYRDAILEHLIDLKDDGSFWLNQDYFDYLRGQTMTNERFHRLFGGTPRAPDSSIENRHLDVARSIQAVTEEIMLRLAKHAREVTGCPRLCLAGGVALNCVANGRILKNGIFDEIWIQPAAGDAGGALGAALIAWKQSQSENESSSPELPPPSLPMGERDEVRGKRDMMQGALLGPEYSAAEIKAALNRFGVDYERADDETLIARTVQYLCEEKTVGWFQGRMEFGPRALGNRSILGDPRSARMQSEINLKVKFRESFRPFAPAVLKERVADYFELETDSPYMLLVTEVAEPLRRKTESEGKGLERLHEIRSAIPAVTHVDFSARVQTVDEDSNPLFYRLLKAFEHETGCGVLINTSFNVRGEPIVCSPEDAYRCFINTNLDYLVIGNYILDRKKQPAREIKQAFHPVPD